MEPNTPPFEVTETDGGRTYRLPPRRLGPLHYLAALPLFVALAGLTLIAQYAIRRAGGGQLDEWGWALLALSTLGWTRACYTLASLAASLWDGRTELRVGDDTSVVAVERSGWFRLRIGRLKAGAARKLVLSELAVPATEKTMPVTFGPDLWRLTAETDRGAIVWLALGHPRAALAALADELAARLALAPIPQVDPNTGEQLGRAELVPVPVVVEEVKIPSRDVVEQPPDSRIAVERHPDGVTVTVPPLGFFRSQGCFGLVFGLVFSVVGVALLLAFVNGLIAPPPPPPPRPRGRGDGPTWLGFVFLGVGITAVLASIHHSRKRVVLAVVGDQLLTLETGPLGSRRRSFIRAELLDVACGPSNVSSNNKALPQLQIRVHGGRAPVGLLTGRDELELKWLATVLRQSLGIPSEPPERRKKSENPG